MQRNKKKSPINKCFQLNEKIKKIKLRRNEIPDSSLKLNSNSHYSCYCYLFIIFSVAFTSRCFMYVAVLYTFYHKTYFP